MSNELLTVKPMDEYDFRSYLISLGWVDEGEAFLSPNGLSRAYYHGTHVCLDGAKRVRWEIEPIDGEDPLTLEEMEAYLASWHESEPEWGVTLGPVTA